VIADNDRNKIHLSAVVFSGEYSEQHPPAWMSDYKLGNQAAVSTASASAAVASSSGSSAMVSAAGPGASFSFVGA